MIDQKRMNTKITARAQLLLRWLRNVAQVQFSPSSGYRLSLRHSFMEIFYNIAIKMILLPISRFFRLHFCRRQYASDFNQFNVVAAKATGFGEITQNNGHCAVG